jgi:hypothetical protein
MIRRIQWTQISTLGSQEFAGGAIGVVEGAVVVYGGAIRVVGGFVVVSGGAISVVGGFVVVVAFGVGGGVGFGSCAGEAMGVGEAVVSGNVLLGRGATLVGGGFMRVVMGAFGGGAPPCPVGSAGATAFWFNVSWRLSGVTHTPSPTKASRHTYPGLQVSGPYAPPPGWRRLAALAFSCATSAATCLVTHT